MKEYRENIIEYPINTWEGASVRVTVHHPDRPKSLTSQIILDSHDFETLKWLNPPHDIELVDKNRHHFLLIEWDRNRKQAENIVDMISKKIANHLTRAFIHD